MIGLVLLSCKYFCAYSAKNGAKKAQFWRLPRLFATVFCATATKSAIL
jgi:hypothetical protein